MYRLALFLTLVFYSNNQSFAGVEKCHSPAKELISSVGFLIERSDKIVIVTAARWSGPLLDRESINLPVREKVQKVGKSEQSDRNSATLPFYTLSVLETLKGDDVDTVMVIGAPPFTKEQQAKRADGKSPWMSNDDYEKSINKDFDAHKDEIFWNSETSGRSSLDAKCAVRPMFLNKGRYLVFTGPPHVKAYEAINVEDDRWLAYVRRKLADGTSDGGK